MSPSAEQQAVSNGQTVLYVTERAVFQLSAQGVALVEVAPGIDLKRDIFTRMAFRPIVGELVTMPRG